MLIFKVLFLLSYSAGAKASAGFRYKTFTGARRGVPNKIEVRLFWQLGIAASGQDFASMN